MCCHCNKIFQSKSDLEKHHRADHVCSVCKEVKASKRHLDRHFKHHHPYHQQFYVV
jgi:hypothetical protein